MPDTTAIDTPTVNPSFLRFHKPSCAQSDLTTEDSITLSSFHSTIMETNNPNNDSSILKENFSSINTNNVTFGDFACLKEKKENNLAYAVCAKFPPRIKKQVHSIIDYYENQLQGQRQMFWKAMEGQKKQQAKRQQQQRQEQRQREEKEEDDCVVSLNESLKNADSTRKDQRISELEDKLLEKNGKISQLNMEITTLMGKYARLKKQSASSPTRSIKSAKKDETKDFQ